MVAAESRNDRGRAAADQPSKGVFKLEAAKAATYGGPPPASYLPLRS